MLALAEAGEADYLVTGDKSGLLMLRKHKATTIIAARDFAERLALREGLLDLTPGNFQRAGSC